MIKNYFKMAFRGFWRHKLFTLINIIGLSIGISASLVIYLIVHYNFTFDKFHKDSGRIYRVVSDFTNQGEKGYNSGVCGPLAGAVKSQVPGVEAVAPFFVLSQPNVFITGRGNVMVTFKNQNNIILANTQYFKIFNYQWLAGNAENALDAPNQVVLTLEQAKKYFPSVPYSEVIGKMVTYDTLKTTVTGIVQTSTQNSDFTFHDFISYSTATMPANNDLGGQLQLTEWNSTNSSSQVFIKLTANASSARIQQQLNDILKKNSPPKPNDKANTHSFSLQQLNDLHFNENYGSFDGGTTVNKTTLYGLLIIAFFLLLLACINFINLTTAHAAQRAKEIGIRKTLGSSRKQLIFQFLSETFLITAIAVIISIFLSPVILTLFGGFIPKGVKPDFFQPDLILFLLLLVVVVSFASGFYPAILLSGYKPIAVLKNQSQNNSSKTRNAWLRKSLTVTQFVIAQFFIMATILVSKQIYYALHKDLGFKKDAIIIVDSPWKNRTKSKKQVFLNKLRSIPQINLVSVGNDMPSSYNSYSTTVSYKEGKKEIETEVFFKFGDENYIPLYQIKLVAGRNLLPGDSTSSVVINSTYAHMLGFRNSSKAIGITLHNFFDGIKSRQVVGVVADFYQSSLHVPIKPIAIYNSTNVFKTGSFSIALKPQTASGNEWKTAINGIEKSWKEVYPDDDFNYRFFDESIAKFYDSEQHTSTLLTWAMGLSIFISCLGLLGLTIYTANQRTKEIGVRKVLGATVTQLVTLLSTELVLLMLLAFVLVTPIGWYAMNKWMQTFADRTSISWWIFASTGGGMLIIAMLTSGFQTIKTALTNPVKSLRSE